jgi:hypothetical protein
MAKHVAETPSFTKLVFRMLGRTIKDMLCTYISYGTV